LQIDGSFIRIALGKQKKTNMAVVAVQAPENYVQRGRQLWRALLFFFAAGFLLPAYVVWSEYRDVRTEAELTARNYADLIDARFDATLRRIDADLTRLAERVPAEWLSPQATPAAHQALERDLARYQLGFPEVGDFRVVDAQGNLLSASPAVNVADRAYFALARDNPQAITVFSDVLVSRLNGDQVMVAARAIRDVDGRFLGVVMVHLQLRQFEHLFDSVKLGSGGALAILRTDSHMPVLHAPVTSNEGAQPLGEEYPLYERLAAGSTFGNLDFVSPVDGVRRIYAYRVLEKYPFYVLAGLSVADLRDTWWQRITSFAVISVLLFAGFGLILFGLFRAQEREVLALASLRRSKEQLKTAQRIARLGSWELDLATQRLTASSELRDIFEIVTADADFPYEDFLAKVHPDDRVSLEMMINEAIRERRHFQHQHRLLLADGRVKHVKDIGEVCCAEDGGARSLVATSQDVTSQYQMESRLQLLASAFQYSGEAILITDSANHIVTVNPAFTKLTGYTAEDALGRNPSFLSAGRTTPEEYREMWRRIIEYGFWQGEIWDRRKDGGIYPKWVSISVIRDNEGGVRHYIAHFTDISSERAADAQLEHIAHHDVLTGLLNRLSLKGRLDQALAAARREGVQVALLFIDLDRFKVINDTLGHHIGDKLLIEVAGRLRDSVRDSDVVARLGGDEFVIMLSSMESSGSAAVVAEKLIRNIGDPYQIDGYDLYTTPSIGIAIFPIDGEDGDTLMKNADAAMYHAKAAGRNNSQFFDARMNDAALERLKIEHSLRQALAREEFCVYYQPLIDLATGKVDGVEALVRWQHPEMGMVSPASFIGIAEETGLIQPIGEWVFWSACRQLAAFNAAGFSGLKMSINISAMQLRNGNLPVLAKGAIELFGLEPSTLMFEITESVAMHQPEETVRILNSLHDMGVGLAIDDFGTGYSSLSYLRMFPINHLKLDRSFVREIGLGPDSSVICDATIGLAHNLGLKLVAEGVETQAQYDYLRQKGCDLIQGYLFSRPIPADQVLEYIRQRN
jgi:diguanylate cyclase (GGDEF)-like protein/PAS domain S-box-containing protein